MTFEEANAVSRENDSNMKVASEALKVILRREGVAPGAITPDRVRALPDYRVAKRNSEIAFQSLRNFNQAYSKIFKKEIAADLKARIASGNRLANR